MKKTHDMDNMVLSCTQIVQKFSSVFFPSFVCMAKYIRSEEPKIKEQLNDGERLRTFYSRRL